MNTRKITENDWPILTKWWSEWEYEYPPVKSFLPENGTFGLIVEKDNKPIASIFMYATNASLVILGWPLSDKNYDSNDREKAIIKLNESAETACKLLGYKHILFFGDNKKYIKKLKDLNFSKGDSKYDLITKNI